VSAAILTSFCNLRTPDEPPLCLFTGELDVPPLVPAISFSDVCGVTGLAADREYVYCAAQIRLAYRDSPHPTPASELITFDRDGLRLCSRYRFRLARDVHSIVAIGDTLLAVSTATDAIVELALRRGQVTTEHVRWRADTSGAADELHLNSLARDGGDLLVSGFGRGTGDHWDSARDGFVFALPLRAGVPDRVLAQGLVQPHSLLVRDGEVLLCESGNHAVRTLTATILDTIPGYPRGLCQIGSTLFVATSVGRRSSRGVWKGRCAIKRIEVGGLTVAGDLPVPSAAHEIYDLLPLDPEPVPDGRYWHCEDQRPAAGLPFS
jgi:Domain of unknown function (DUF4915)